MRKQVKTELDSLMEQAAEALEQLDDCERGLSLLSGAVADVQTKMQGLCEALLRLQEGGRNGTAG